MGKSSEYIYQSIGIQTKFMKTFAPGKRERDEWNQKEIHIIYFIIIYNIKYILFII